VSVDHESRRYVRELESLIELQEKAIEAMKQAMNALQIAMTAMQQSVYEKGQQQHFFQINPNPPYIVGGMNSLQTSGKFNTMHTTTVPALHSPVIFSNSNGGGLNTDWYHKKMQELANTSQEDFAGAGFDAQWSAP
jgi:hypothetical protein